MVCVCDVARPRCGGVPRPEAGGAEEEIRVQVPPSEGGRRREDLPRQHDRVPRRLQHVRHRRLGRIRLRLGRLQQETSLSVPQVSSSCSTRGQSINRNTNGASSLVLAVVREFMTFSFSKFIIIRKFYLKNM